MPKAQQAGANAAESSFNQILSREVAERHNIDESKDAGKTNSKEAAGAAAPNQAAAAPAGEKTVDKDEPRDTDAAAAPAVLNAADAASAQILALAVQFAQASATQAEAPATGTGMLEDASGRAAGAGKDGLALPAWMPELSDNKRAADPGKDVQRNAPDFDALMDEAHDLKQPLDLIQLKVQDTQPAPAATALAMAPLQPVVLDRAQMAAGHPMEKLTPQVGTSGWDQALGQKVVWMVAGAQQSASLTLNPPDLGPLQVVLNVTNSQATANFFSTQPEVRQALEAALPRLREMLGDAGIQLGQANVSAGAPHQHQQGGSGEQRQTSRRSDQGGGDSVELPLNATRGTLPAGRQGMVDTFA